jgi:hypothetical protein
MVVAASEYLANAMFDAFVGTLEPEGVWYEYSWYEYQPVYAVRRNWWGRKQQVQVSEEKVVKSTGMSRLGYSVDSRRVTFQTPEPFPAEGAAAYDLLLNMYATEDGAVPFVSQQCSSYLRVGETFRFTGPPVLGVGGRDE